MITIGISKLRLSCRIGCYPEEREKLQELSIDFSMQTQPAQHDSIECTVNYVEVVNCVRHVCMEKEFYLLETLAQNIVEASLAQFPAISTFWIKIVKPRAVDDAESSFVVYERKRARA